MLLSSVHSHRLASITLHYRLDSRSNVVPTSPFPDLIYLRSKFHSDIPIDSCTLFRIPLLFNHCVFCDNLTSYFKGPLLFPPAIILIEIEFTFLFLGSSLLSIEVVSMPSFSNFWRKKNLQKLLNDGVEIWSLH